MGEDKDKITFEEYLNGLKHGEHIGYFENGVLWYKRQYLNGLKHGEQLGYYSNGKLLYKQQFLNGLKHGEQISYNYTDSGLHKEYYINDKLVSYEEWIKYKRNQKLQSIWNKIK